MGNNNSRQTTINVYGSSNISFDNGNLEISEQNRNGKELLGHMKKFQTVKKHIQSVASCKDKGSKQKLGMDSQTDSQVTSDEVQNLDCNTSPKKMLCVQPVEPSSPLSDQEETSSSKDFQQSSDISQCLKQICMSTEDKHVRNDKWRNNIRKMSRILEKHQEDTRKWIAQVFLQMLQILVQKNEPPVQVYAVPFQTCNRPDEDDILSGLQVALLHQPLPLPNLRQDNPPPTAPPVPVISVNRRDVRTVSL